MKKLFVSALAMLAVALGFTACSSEDELVNETPAQGQKVTVIATTEEPAQRTALQKVEGKEEYKVVWSAGDKIKIGGKEFTLTSGDGTSTGEFEGEALTEGTGLIAYYPATYTGSVATKATYQEYVENNIPLGVPMKATDITVDESGNISPIKFYNEGGILRLNLTGEAKVTSIKICATGLATITLSCRGGGVQLNNSTPTPFYIAVPGTEDGTAYSGLKILITDNQGKICAKSLRSEKTITVQRSKITDVTLSANNFEKPEYLCLTAQEANAIVKKDWATLDGDVEYTTDLVDWYPFTSSYSKVTLANVSDKIYFRGLNPSGFKSENLKFDLEGPKVAASGNVMSLIDPTCKETTIPCDECFQQLFYNCTNLTAAPKLPATTVTKSCYYDMFYWCEALETAPELPATTLADGCYSYMFYGCEALKTAPELPATTLAVSCYNHMFYNCYALETAPTQLPATTLADGCYSYMFYGCSNLTSITCLATDLSATNCTTSWVYNCSSTGTFTKAKGVTWASGKSGIPSGWSIVEK